MKLLITQFFPFSLISFFLILTSWPNYCGRRELLLHLITLSDTHTTIGRTPLEAGSASRTDLYLTTHNTHKRKTPTLPAGFEPAIPASELPLSHALHRAATTVGFFLPLRYKYRHIGYHSSYFRRITASTVAMFT